MEDHTLCFCLLCGFNSVRGLPGDQQRQGDSLVDLLLPQALTSPERSPAPLSWPPPDTVGPGGEGGLGELFSILLSPLSCPFCCQPSPGRATAGLPTGWLCVLPAAWPFRLCEWVSGGEVKVFWNSECCGYSPFPDKLCSLTPRSFLSTWE